MRKQTKLYNNKEANFKALGKCVYSNFVFYLKRPSFKGTVGITSSNEKNGKTINAKTARYFLAFVHTFYWMESNEEEVWIKELVISKLFIYQIIALKKIIGNKSQLKRHLFNLWQLVEIAVKLHRILKANHAKE